ncbi:MAG: FtsX-like permease family protein, partial [Candidatus Hermodarchaeota archaeon]
AGVIISSTTFATITLGTNALFMGMVDQSLEEYPVDIEASSFLYKQWSSSLINQRNEINEISLVQHAEIVTRVQTREFWGPDIETSRWEAFVGIENHSRVYDGINVIAGNSTLGPNQVWVVNSSVRRPDFNLLDLFNLTFTVIVSHPEFPYDYPRNFTLQVAGFVTVTDQALEILVGDYEGWKQTPERDLYITSWDLTFRNEMDITHNLVLGYPFPPAFEHSIMVMLDRSAVINPIDLQGSFTRLTAIEAQVQEIVDYPDAYVFDYLKENIDASTEESLDLLLMFLISSIPIFFIALYLGVTMSDVTFNLRRREIGLLVTKGARRPTILRIFLFESLLIGVIAGLLSIGISILILPILLGPISLFQPFSDFSLPLMVIIILFAVLIAFFSTYSSAQHAARIPTVEALREYSPSTHPSEYSKKVVWIALLFGTYKIVMWLTGLNPLTVIMEIGTPALLLMIVLSTWLVFDFVVTPVAILLFIYGLSKLLIQGSSIIYKVSKRIMRPIMGGIGELATRSIKRSPERTAAIVFLLALVISYGTHTLSVLGSEQDYIYRSLHAEVGSDISASVVPPLSGPLLVPSVENISGVESVAAEFWTYVSIGSVWDISLRAINASQWSQTAYYEEDWFSGVSSNLAFNALSANNLTIILQRGIAQTRNISVGDQISVWRGDNRISLTVEGFFGPAEFSTIETLERHGDYSIVNIELLEYLELIDGSTCRLLIECNNQVDVNDIMMQIEAFPVISTVDSFHNKLAEYSLNPILSAPGNILRIQVFFSFLLASAGTAIIITASLREKERDLALMAARGSSKNQTQIVLLGETTLWILFALIIGGFSGFVVSYATLIDLTALDAFIPRNLAILFSPTLFLQILGLILLLMVFAIVPILQATRRAQKGAEVLRSG